MRNVAVALSPAMKRFVLQWGEMGSRWGINRTVAQIHALLYISPDPLNAEQIQASLGVARSNVSMSLKELLAWGIVEKVPISEDRRMHYRSLTDVWEMFRTVARERKRRELDPTFEIVGECLAQAGQGDSKEEYFRERLEDLVAFFDDLTAFYDSVESMQPKTMQRLFRAGKRLHGLLGRGKQK